ncbi:hypothetical protein BAUCODRAFT_286771 [Baudoinia panamericana UAMH 10762]|uniref:Zn(2)-C6 fungal-type domain-containing protein n=1 Tax=Baudoinia panamericana (strain UAMH 10762) TaxID=717646 RepID=M2N156_BAUPA|nr:uncharacterized protein BAUCODRAFT_286771 [Baudoinia panamericana UAMH 10762]EMC92370.1 hypothetical protein BAUCODRAFT_286771 [Baudoinia panamericana UAMH 10762]
MRTSSLDFAMSICLNTVLQVTGDAKPGQLYRHCAPPFSAGADISGALMSSAGRHQPPPLIAARSSKGSDSGSGDGSRTPTNSEQRLAGGRPKRTLIESACSACRRRKSRCDGARPSCTRCQTLRTNCQYEAEEGESRWSALRRRNHILETERNELRELLGYLQSLSEPDAQELFHRIRNGGYEEVFTLVAQLRERDGVTQLNSLPRPPPMLHQGSTSSSSGNEQRLPPISVMFEVSSGGPPPANVPALNNYYTSPTAPTFPPNLPRAQSDGSNYSRGSQSSNDYPWSATSAP